MKTIKTLFHKIQVLALDALARKCARMNYLQKAKLARIIAALTLPLPWVRRGMVSTSLMEHLNIDAEAAQKLSKKVFEQFLINSFEMAGLRYFTNDEVLNRVRVEGLENLRTALAGKKGAILISGHFGVWELVSPWLVLNGFDITMVVRRQSNIFVDTWFEEMRQKHGAKTTDSGFGLREILKSLRKGHLLALMVDQDNGKQGIFVKFFNRWASSPTGPAQISLKTGAPIVPLAIFPDYRGKHLLTICPPIYPESYPNDVAGQQQLTSAFTAFLEKIIRKQPEQWFWLHRRWKTQPEDAPENASAKLALTSLPEAGDNISRQ